MSILNKLQTQGSNLSKLNGRAATVPNFKLSQTHDQYSINGEPNISGKPSPSTLDLDGKTPSKYTDNLPE